jgi:hypothetical protein
MRFSFRFVYGLEFMIWGLRFRGKGLGIRD